MPMSLWSTVANQPQRLWGRSQRWSRRSAMVRCTAGEVQRKRCTRSERDFRTVRRPKTASHGPTPYKFFSRLVREAEMEALLFDPQRAFHRWMKGARVREYARRRRRELPRRSLGDRFRI